MWANSLVLKPEKVAKHETSGTNIFYTVQKYVVKEKKLKKLFPLIKFTQFFIGANF